MLAIPSLASYAVRNEAACEVSLVRARCVPESGRSVSERVYVHIGLPKTGTTFLQSALWDGRGHLAAKGCLVPGEERASSWRAASDLLGRRPKSADARNVSGTWHAVAREIREWRGDRAIFSEELLATANRRQVQRLASSVGGEVHAVVTVRDLDRVLPSLWQQQIRQGRTYSWPEFVASVRDPEQGSVHAAAAFWLRFDLEKVLRIWAGELSPERIHVVVVPPAGSPATALLELFAAAVGIEPVLLQRSAPEAQSNPALGRAELETLRRLNVALGGQLNERQYARAVVKAVIPELEKGPPSARVTVPPEARPWLDELSARQVAHLRTGAYDVIGEPDDLLPVARGSTTQPDELAVNESSLVAPLVDALAAVCTTYANHWWKSRRREGDVSRDASVRIASTIRAATYRAKSQVLAQAERNRALRWVSLAYLRRRG